MLICKLIWLWLSVNIWRCYKQINNSLNHNILVNCLTFSILKLNIVSFYICIPSFDFIFMLKEYEWKTRKQIRNHRQPPNKAIPTSLYDFRISCCGSFLLCPIIISYRLKTIIRMNWIRGTHNIFIWYLS